MSVFAALADPIRRDLLSRLAVGPCRVVDLAADHPVTRPAISRHLKILADAGLVQATDRGRERHYTLESAALADVVSWCSSLSKFQPPVSDRDLDAFETEARRTARDRAIGDATKTEQPTTKEHTA